MNLIIKDIHTYKVIEVGLHFFTIAQTIKIGRHEQSIYEKELIVPSTITRVAYGNAVLYGIEGTLLRDHHNRYMLFRPRPSYAGIEGTYFINECIKRSSSWHVYNGNMLEVSMPDIIPYIEPYLLLNYLKP